MGRHPYANRWPNALAAGLGGGARVIEEGLNGRMTVHDDPTVAESRNGAVALPMLLATHQPLDLVIIMLGTNDLKRFRAIDAMWGMERLIEIVQNFLYNENYPKPKLLIVSPPQLATTGDEDFDAMFGHAIEESRKFSYHYGRLAKLKGVHFFDAAPVAAADPVDGVHLDAAATRALGEALVPKVRSILDLGC
ncbi:MAG: GDSL-type esterase/lipase family protein [Pseudomonadota bacterium]|nr:GDSL-type esterase/lipase family protein [Pseudomonadota bacterium]